MQNLRPQNSLASPGTLIREHDLSNYNKTPSLRQPVCLIFGFSSRGPLLEPRYFSSTKRMIDEYGLPETSLEKYFLNAGNRVIEGGGTAMMTRLPYDNFSCNNVKFIRYSVGEHITKEEIYYDDESYEKYSEQDNEGVMALNALNELDDTIRGYSRITLASKTVEYMSENDFYECTYDASKLDDESIYIFDIRKQQMGTNPLLTNSNEVEYLGIVPVLVGPSTALYFQEKIENNKENDKLFNPISLPITLDDEGNVVKVDPAGFITDAPWKDEFTNDECQEALKQILTSFSQVVDFNHTGTFYDKRTVSDVAANKFPLIRWRGAGRLEKKYLDQLGIVVFEMVFNKDTEKVDFIPRETFVGYIANTDAQHPPLEITINNSSEYIYMIRKISKRPQRDYFHITNQPIVSMGMLEGETEKKLNYMKSIMEPIQHVLDSQYADVDACHIDLILDAGISTAAHYAWDKYTDTTTFVDTVKTKTLDYKRDKDGKLVLDTYGNPMLDVEYRRDENKNLILDENGNPMLELGYEKDADGNYVLDGDGNPIPIEVEYKETVLAYGPDSAFYFNPAKEDVSPSSRLVEQCSTAWMNVTKMFTKFIEYRRGDSLYLADGPRCLNVSRQAPYLLHYPELDNNEIFNKYIGYFSDLSTSYGARFWNWVLAKDYFSSLSIWTPPSIIAAQVMCRSDRSMFPWYASAGFQRGVVPNAYEVSLKTKPYTDENDILYQNNWNYFTDNMGVGIVLEGNKTMQVEATALDRINVRKLCNYIKRNLRDISNKYKYEPNTEEARIMYREDIADFLTYIQKNAGLEDFAVICNDSNNPPEVIERNELRCQVWIKPVKAIEFIIIDLSVTSQNVEFTDEFTHT